MIYDVAIIGGGINGCGCAADAALRGLSVFLCEQADIASKTSSSSTKLIHGGLRYLENYDFSLVKKALIERQLLLDLAPHLVHPQVFVLPYQPFMRPDWMLRTGLFIYDHLTRKNRLPTSRSISNKTPLSSYFLPLKKSISKGFVYYDAVTDDSRLTLENALQAKKHGAKISTNTQLINAEVKQGIWQLTLEENNQSPYTIQAKTVINATGPWVNIVAQTLNTPIEQEITWVKGSHILLAALYPEQHAYILQHSDKRIVFVLPFHGYSMIGTTDVAYDGNLNEVSIDDQEIDYLCTIVNEYFKVQIAKEEIVYSWSGVRPLLSESEKALKSLSRDYKHVYSETPAPNISIYGGKITTYRKLAEEVIDSLGPVLKNENHSLSQHRPLPGAMSSSHMPYSDYCLKAKRRYSWLDITILERYLATYGCRTEELLSDCHHQEDLGFFFGNSLYQKEVEYLIQEEWATTTEDILWRRTKLGLGMRGEEIKALEDFIKRYTS